MIENGPTLSVVIPVYNEERTIATVIDRVERAAPGVDKEIVVSNDGSTDGTGAILRQAEADGRIVLVDGEVNRGKGAALRAAISRARGSIVLVQDADLEMDPADYPILLAPILAGTTSVVYGSRFLGRGGRRAALANLLANKLIVAFTNLLYGSCLSDVETAFKVFRRDVIGGIRLTCNRFDFEPEVSGKLMRMGHAIQEVPITYDPRTKADGKKVGFRDGLDALWVLLKCRFMPMRLIAADEPR